MATAIAGDVGSSGSSLEHSYIAMSVFLFLDVVFHLSPLKKKRKKKNFSVLPYLEIKYHKSWKYCRSAKSALNSCSAKSSLLAFMLENSMFGSCCLLPFPPVMLWMEPMSPGWLSWPYSSLSFPHVRGNLFSCFCTAALISLSSAAVFQNRIEQKFSLPYFSSLSQQCSFWLIWLNN